MKALFNQILFLFFLGFTGCSGLLNNTGIHARREETLLKAGFKPVPITATQEKKLQSLSPSPVGKITSIERHGKIYFIYPDFKHHQILVGRNRQFMQYNELVANQLTPPRKKILHKGEQEHLEWEESGVWDNRKGWESVGWDNPSFLAY